MKASSQFSPSLPSGSAAVKNPAFHPGIQKADKIVKQDWKSQKEEQARQRKRQNALKKAEASISSLEARDSEINELLSREEVYTNVARLVELNQEKEELASRLEALYEQWEQLAEET